jgi:Uma2 family endonuclease
VATKTSAVTADELLRMPNDGGRFELVRGEVTRMAPAGQRHGRIAMNLATSLNASVRAQGLGVVYAAETGFLLATTPDTVRAPDVAFVSRERLTRQGEVEGYWPGAPDLVVEVISPTDRYADVEDKLVDWLAAGARLVVVVNPRKQVVTLYRSFTQIAVLGLWETLEAPDVVPGWALPVDEVFQ